MIRRTLAVVALAIVLVYLAICGLLYVSQRGYLYFPVPRQGNAPAFVLHRGDADVVVSTNGVDSPAAVLFFGGNAEDVSQAIPLLTRAFPGRAVFAMHYRSYGGSTGQPSEVALVADGKRLFDLLAKEHPSMVLVGRSLGSGIALQVAVGRRVEHLVLVTPYDSISGLAQQRFPLFPVRWILRDTYESWRYAAKIHVPTTLVVAGRDEVIPNTSSRLLASRFPRGVASIVTFADANHNDISGFDGYADALGQR
ncbi:MAG: alpha/beta fold hydrolase [Thermomonas sp.]|uniref:alpha/beta hydrolase n=1 Tax=Thermomonas sp. TaxID=1971895 RepID=UPI002636131C|nr:alpha/beta hydrolase [Thermomonas sp.]MCC7097606.1 alpha/beta fold hydrolase [Thermomonas sp.]